MTNTTGSCVVIWKMGSASGPRAGTVVVVEVVLVAVLRVDVLRLVDVVARARCRATCVGGAATARALTQPSMTPHASATTAIRTPDPRRLMLT
ncbi:MAG TPA: hypothetical protein VFR41_10630 [Acidimicrobiia bacterium]|nr:hypothetical protein [Acidimicrobiia bacterium]